MTTPLRLGFDIGGTFTDFVLADPATGQHQGPLVVRRETGKE